MQTKENQRDGFTLIELLVVISIMALLMAILLPSLRRAREQAKETLCASYLAGFGKGFYVYSGENDDFLCSGAFDPDCLNGRDGPVDQIGWVADLVNSGTHYPGKALCPSNAAQVNQKLGQGPSAGFYTPEEADKLIERGYNTNYTQSWYMGRTQSRWPNENGDPNWKRIRFKNTPCESKARGPTFGPLRVSSMVKVSPSRVPLLGDGGIETADRHRDKITVKTMSDGPFGGSPYGAQDYSDFGPAHGFGKQIYDGYRSSNRDRANILFGDGHVAPFIDKVRNGQFNLTNRTADNPSGEQEDLDAKVFDGVLNLGRRSKSEWTLE